MSVDVASPPDRDEICRVYGLGTALAEWSPVGGARSHAMWRLDTDRGRFAVKVFDRSVDSAQGDLWTELRDAFALELAAMHAGLPMPRPVAVAGGRDVDLLAEVSGSGGPAVVRIHEWVQGEQVPDDVDQQDLAEDIGGLLGRIHLLPVPCTHDHAAGLTQTQPDDYLVELVDIANRQEQVWAPALDRARNAYAVTRELAARQQSRPLRLIITHRDVVPKNVLLSGEHTAILVDWDVAGPWTAEEEVAAGVLEWTGNLSRPLRRETMDAFVRGYRATGGKLDISGPEVFSGWLIKNANWAEMHVRRALDESLPKDRREVAGRLAPELLERLERCVAGVDTWADWLRQAQ